MHFTIEKSINITINAKLKENIKIWNSEIYPSLKVLKTLLDDDILNELEYKLKDLEEIQWWIIDISKNLNNNETISTDNQNSIDIITNIKKALLSIDRKDIKLHSKDMEIALFKKNIKEMKKSISKILNLNLNLEEREAIDFIQDELKAYEFYMSELLKNKRKHYLKKLINKELNPLKSEVTNILNLIDEKENLILNKNKKINQLLGNISLFASIGLLSLIGFIILFMFKRTKKLSFEVHSKDKQISISQSILNDYKNAVDMSAIVSKTNPKGIITYVNEKFCEISGYSKDELIGKSHNIIRHPKSDSKIFKNLWQTILNKKSWKGVIRNKRKDGRDYFVNTTIVPFFNEDGEIIEFMSIRSDITKLIEKERRIQKQTTDMLTKLPNRQKLIEDIKISSSLRLAIINIDRFKEINDYYGYDIGDSVLIESAKRVLHLSLKSSIVYKLSGDEFAILDNSVKLNEFEDNLKLIIDSFITTSLIVDENEFNISIAIGTASGEKNIFLNSEIALENARETNKSFISYNENINIQKRHKDNIEWTKTLKDAIKEDRIVVFAQPIINNKNGKTEKYECLVRLKLRDGKIISPFFFIDTAKRAKLYDKLTKIIIEKSFKYFATKEDIEFSINLTIEDILNPEIVKYLKKSLQKFNIANRVVLEIVESEGINIYR